MNSKGGIALKVAYFGDGPWAHRALSLIFRESRIRVEMVVARCDNPDPILAGMAAEAGVPFETYRDVNAGEAMEKIRLRGIDLGVSMSFNQIIRRPLLAAFPVGFINCHAGALPFYRGRNVLNWAIANGEARFGVTVHYIDEGIDTGDIILQNFGPITPWDDYGSVLERAYELCAVTLNQALLEILAGTAGRVPQNTYHPVGHYCGRRRLGDEWIDWSSSASRLCDFIRAIAPPGPSARTVIGEKPIAILSVRLIPGAPDYVCTPGEVVGRESEGCTVKVGDSTVRVTGFAEIDAAGEVGLRQVPQWPIGTRLGANLLVRLNEMERRLAMLESKLAAGVVL